MARLAPHGKDALRLVAERLTTSGNQTLDREQRQSLRAEINQAKRAAVAGGSLTDELLEAAYRSYLDGVPLAHLALTLWRRGHFPSVHSCTWELERSFNLMAQAA